jgi:hypothetical protein
MGGNFYQPLRIHKNKNCAKRIIFTLSPCVVRFVKNIFFSHAKTNQKPAQTNVIYADKTRYKKERGDYSVPRRGSKSHPNEKGGLG